MKLFSHIKLSIVLMAMIPTIALAFDYPADGETQTVWTVTGECTAMPEDFRPGAVWDMSDAVISDVHSRLYRIYGDTLVTRTSDGIRDMFLVYGDTVWHLGINDRASQHRSTGRGVPYRFPMGTQALELTDSVGTNIVFGDGGTLGITAQVLPVRGGSIVFADGDTVRNTSGYRTDIDYGDFTQTLYRWYAEGLMYPVAEYTDLSDSLGTVLACTLVCPPGEQRPMTGPSRSKALMTMQYEEDDTDIDDTGIPTLPDDAYNLNQDGEWLCIAFSEGWGDTAVTLSDSLGRIYHQGSGDCTLDIGTIHERPLLLTLRCRGMTITVKITK